MRGALIAVVCVILAGCSGAPATEPATSEPASSAAPEVQSAPTVSPPESAAPEAPPAPEPAPTPEESPDEGISLNVSSPSQIHIYTPFTIGIDVVSELESAWSLYGNATILSQDSDSASVQFNRTGTYVLTVEARNGVHAIQDSITITAYAEEPDWGEPTEGHIRPGAGMTGTDGCTVNFMFHHNWERFFIGTAAHCVGTQEPASGNGEPGLCDGEPYDPEDDPIHFRGNTDVIVRTAYNSVVHMKAMGWTHDTNWEACRYNDFALLEINYEDLKRFHPASTHFAGPTGLGSTDDYAAGDTVYGYGRSSLRYGVVAPHDNPVTEIINRKQGTLGIQSGQYGWEAYMGTPAIPGDSGGPLITSDGQAMGIASTISALGHNVYAMLDQCLLFMEEHEGWAPELITWDDWNPSLV